ncbi:uncharacterized protein LOC117641839 [Thrips palmi]|uniref:Uncharacterized protein LOC117641839 n=1 Tax=Thrips palmi TaxID=161013 RepID=A0A6P8Y711_THRPL|nr:uncharacterized protein LOC117641839 [Thrips palmi]XP_034235408.1 uncharacterized protein LOC117641839 [Thrips palmi]
MAEDLLDILRDCVENKRQIKEVNGKICLGERHFPKSVDTTFPIHLPKGDKQQEFYKLHEVLFFMDNHTLTHPEYSKRAQEKKIRCVRRPDRKPLLLRIYGDSGVKTVKTRSATRHQPNQINDSPSFVPEDSTPSSSQNQDIGKRKLQMDRGTFEIKKQKTNIRTYSRKRSPHEFRRQDSANEDHTSDMDNINSITSEELDLVKNDNLAMDQALKSMTSFLKDHLGVTDDQLNIIQNSESNTVDLSNVASEVKNKIVHAGVFLSTKSSSRTNVDVPRQCYRAIKHPLRGWEMTKQDLSSVLLGDEQLKEHESPFLDDSLSKGSILLKRAFSILISQLKEYNKPLKSHDESDTFCKKIVKDCLTDAVDGFRDIFNELVSSQKLESQLDSLEKWVDVSRTELGKLFNSLIKTLQSLRDISISDHKPPISLFHLPEPTFSLALNPAKVTHSVVLEMYIRMGLAELKQILDIILSHGSETSELKDDESPIENPSNVILVKEETVDALGSDTVENIEFVSPFFGSQSIEQIDSTSQSTSGSGMDPSLQQSNPELEAIVHHTNGHTKTYSNTSSVHSTRSRPRRQSGSDYCQFNMFKTTVGSTLVSSFKKQIQEKINASDFISQ